MLPTTRSSALRATNALTHSSKPSSTLPDFLLPSFSSLTRPIPSSRAPFSSTRPNASRIGLAPLALPEGVTLSISDPPASKNAANRRVAASRTVHVSGPLGQLSTPLPPYMTLSHDESGKKAFLSIADRTVREQRQMWGTTRAYLNNYIMGVSEGHSTILRLNGVGYRALIEKAATTKNAEYEGQVFVSLKVGYSHPIELGVPKGVKASTPQPTRILLEGSDKEVINQFAAEIRNWRKPEPYKGKGIFVNGETIRLKAKKIK